MIVEFNYFGKDGESTSRTATVLNMTDTHMLCQPFGTEDYRNFKIHNIRNLCDMQGWPLNFSDVEKSLESVILEGIVDDIADEHTPQQMLIIARRLLGRALD